MQHSHKKGSVPFGTPRRALAGTAALLLSAFALPAFGSGIVDEDVFRNVFYETETGMGAALDCIVAGPGKVLLRRNSSDTGRTSAWRSGHGAN